MQTLRVYRDAPLRKILSKQQEMFVKTLDTFGDTRSQRALCISSRAREPSGMSLQIVEAFISNIYISNEDTESTKWQALTNPDKARR